MKRILVTTLVLGTLVVASATKVEKSAKIQGGTFEVGNSSSAMYGVSYDASVIFKYVTLGVQLGLIGSSIDIKNESKSLYGVETGVKLGYNFNVNGKGLGMFATYELFGGNESVVTYGAGAEVEYVFDGGWSVGAKYSDKTLLINSTDTHTDNSTMQGYLGYHW